MPHRQVKGGAFCRARSANCTLDARESDNLNISCRRQGIGITKKAARTKGNHPLIPWEAALLPDKEDGEGKAPGKADNIYQAKAEPRKSLMGR